ncbi:MAG: hypothetical protein IJU87_04065 [Lachnospiraceae bacterium]|nr:hypothetical protein [Lachnospiraceae bacterium]
MKRGGTTDGDISITDTDKILYGTPRYADGKLSFSFVDGIENAGKTAVVTIPVKNAKNYNDYSILVTLTVLEKDVPILSVNDIETVYSGEEVPDSLISGSVTVDGAEVPGSWSFKEGEARTNVSDSGAKTVIFTPDDREGIESGETTLKLSITGKEVVVKADNKEKTEGEADPELTASAEGLLGEDTVEYTLSREPGEEAGTYTIIPSGDREQGNYLISFKPGTFTIKESTPDPDPVPTEDGKTSEPLKVPLAESGDNYAAPLDNFAPTGTSNGNIRKLQLDFSHVKESGVDPADLKMTAINGTKLTTKEKLKDKDSVKTTGGIKAKVNKKTLTAVITCKGSGSAAFTMADGNTYTVNFTVEKPKAQKASKTVAKGSAPVKKTVTELFGTTIDSGELTIVKEKTSGQASVLANKLIIDPKEKDSIKLQYKYLNKKYKMTVKVK